MSPWRIQLPQRQFFTIILLYRDWTEYHVKRKEAKTMRDGAEANWIRLTYFKIQPEKIAEMKKIFYDEIIPVVREQWGNVDIFLLEPVVKEDEFISCTMWESQADGDIYEASGVYGEAVDKIGHTFDGPATLKSYEIPYRS
jgi:heme-degrading monooxygenase HmoA